MGAERTTEVRRRGGRAEPRETHRPAARIAPVAAGHRATEPSQAPRHRAGPASPGCSCTQRTPRGKGRRGRNRRPRTPGRTRTPNRQPARRAGRELQGRGSSRERYSSGNGGGGHTPGTFRRWRYGCGPLAATGRFWRSGSAAGADVLLRRLSRRDAGGPRKSTPKGRCWREGEVSLPLPSAV